MATVTSILKKELADMRKELSTLQARVTAVEETAALALKKSKLRKSAAGRDMSRRSSKQDDASLPKVSTDRIKVTADQVRTLRKKLGISQVEMSMLLGVTSQSISNWERSSGVLPMRPTTKLSWVRLKRMKKADARSRLTKRL